MDREYQGRAFSWQEESCSWISTSTVYGQSSLNRNKEHTARTQTRAKPSPAGIHTTQNTYQDLDDYQEFICKRKKKKLS